MHLLIKWYFCTQSYCLSQKTVSLPFVASQPIPWLMKGGNCMPTPPTHSPLEKPILKSTMLTKLHLGMFQGVITVRNSCACRWILVLVWRIWPQGHTSSSLETLRVLIKNVSGKPNEQAKSLYILPSLKLQTPLILCLVGSTVQEPEFLLSRRCLHCVCVSVVWAAAEAATSDCSWCWWRRSAESLAVCLPLHHVPLSFLPF